MYPRFLTIQDGDYTINVNQIAYVEWNDGESAEVHLIGDNDSFTCEGLDYRNLRNAMGLDEHQLLTDEELDEIFEDAA